MEIISRLLCSMFNSCIVTRGMIIGRFVELLFCASIIDYFGFMITSGENLPITPIYIVGVGTLFIIVLCILTVVTFLCLTIAAYIFTIIIDISKICKKYISKIPLRINFDFDLDEFLDHTVAKCRKK